MIVVFIAELAVGLLCVVLGLVIWKKQKISLVHNYHYKNVKRMTFLPIPGCLESV